MRDSIQNSESSAYLLVLLFISFIPQRVRKHIIFQFHIYNARIVETGLNLKLNADHASIVLTTYIQVITSYYFCTVKRRVHINWIT